MNEQTLQELAERLWSAQTSSTPCDALTESNPEITVENAYSIQEINLLRHVHEGGARRIGHKIGLTSLAVQEWLGVSEPDFGGLLDSMVVANRGRVDTEKLIQPRVEGELAFVLSKGLRGPGITSIDVISATEYILPSIEIIDSRIHDWKFKIQDTIADNASSGMVVFGSQPVPLSNIDTRTIGLTLKKNGSVASTGVGAACLGDPVNALVWLANKLGSLGTEIEAGEVVLTGALGPVVPVEKGDHITVRIGTLSEVSVRF